MASPTMAADLPALVRKLLALTGGNSGVQDGDVFVTGMEVNERHGTGILLQRLYRGAPNIISIRSCDLYNGHHDFGALSMLLSHGDRTRDAVFSAVLRALSTSTVRRVLCVPFYADDVRTALAVKEIFDVPLCTFIMDDRNVGSDAIPDELMLELLTKSSLRLAISPELRVAYELKYGLDIWYLPPVVPASLILSRLNPPPVGSRSDQGIIIGNIWGHQWLSRLRNTVRDSGVAVSWYCSGRFCRVQCSMEDLLADSITPHDPVPEHELLKIIRRGWFAVLPTGTLGPEDDHGFIARLSLPSRLVYLMATAQIPVLVLGNHMTGAARFVKELGIGLVADYDRRSFLEAVAAITEPETNLKMRRNALLSAGRYADAGVGEWIWESLARGGAVDRRFEDLMPAERPDLTSLPGTRVRPTDRSVYVTSNDTDSVCVLVTTNEINDKHGTGPLVKRILAGRRNVFCIRSRDDWGAHDFGDWNCRISNQGRSRRECFQELVRVLVGRRIGQILCVPFLSNELMTSIAIKEAFGARLCTYIMDDQNVVTEAISDRLMREMLEKSALRLATHPELRSAYEHKYGLKFELLPAVVPDELVAKEAVPPPSDTQFGSGALLGSFWDQSWFDQLCSALSACGRRIDWYGNNRAPRMTFPEDALSRAGIVAHGVLPEKELAAALRNQPFAIVPVGTEEGGEQYRGIALLSLPGRILFAAATAQVPVLVVGSQSSCAARFVEHFGLGLRVPYEHEPLKSALDHLCKHNVQLKIRSNAAAIGPAFSDCGVAEWLEDSIDRGKPADNRFENAFAGYGADGATQPLGPVLL